MSDEAFEAKVVAFCGRSFSGRDVLSIADQMGVGVGATIMAAEKVDRLRTHANDEVKGTGDPAKDLEDLRTTIQSILDVGYNYAEEYRWSLEEALSSCKGVAR